MSVETFFQVISWDEAPAAELAGGAKVTRAKVRQTYEGEMRGRSAVEYVMYYRGDGTAIFSGIELFEGSIQGKEGTVVLSHAGTYEGGFAQSQWQIVPGSGTGQLEGATGAGTYRAGHDMKARVLPTIIA